MKQNWWPLHKIQCLILHYIQCSRLNIVWWWFWWWCCEWVLSGCSETTRLVPASISHSSPCASSGFVDNPCWICSLHICGHESVAANWRCRPCSHTTPSCRLGLGVEEESSDGGQLVLLLLLLYSSCYYAVVEETYSKSQASWVQ